MAEKKPHIKRYTHLPLDASLVELIERFHSFVDNLEEVEDDLQALHEWRQRIEHRVRALQEK